MDSRLRQARAIAYPGQTMRQVAAHIGVDASTISRAEASRDPRVSTLLRMAEAYGCDINWLATGAGRRPRRAR